MMYVMKSIISIWFHSNLSIHSGWICSRNAQDPSPHSSTISSRIFCRSPRIFDLVRSYSRVRDKSNNCNLSFTQSVSGIYLLPLPGFVLSLTLKSSGSSILYSPSELYPYLIPYLSVHFFSRLNSTHPSLFWGWVPPQICLSSSHDRTVNGFYPLLASFYSTWSARFSPISSGF